MKITATSEFHGNLEISFIGIKEGINYRKLRGPRSRYCLDYNHNNTHVCGCGYPVTRTSWELPNGYEVNDVRGTGHPDDLDSDYGRGWLRIEIR